MLLDGFGMYDIDCLGLDEPDDCDSEEENDIDEPDAGAYKKLVEDGSQDLFEGCKSFSKLKFVLRLLNWKNTWKVQNGYYDDILSLFKEALPESHVLSRLKNFHASKMYIKHVGIGYDSIHACKNDCCMFRGDFSAMQNCPVCNTSR